MKDPIGFHAPLVSFAERRDIIMQVLIVVPVYNEEENIKPLILDLIHNYPQYDYLIINDGSTDGTLEICKKSGFNVLNLSINLGLSGCFQTGMKYAYYNNYEYVIQFDGDGQHLAIYIERMLERLKKEKADIVIGSRYMNSEKPKGFKVLGSNMIRLAMRFTTGQVINDPTSGMRLYSRELIRQFSTKMNYPPEPDTIAYLIKMGYKIVEEPVLMKDRVEGESYLNVKNILFYMIKMSVSILLIIWFRRKE